MLALGLGVFPTHPGKTRDVAQNPRAVRGYPDDLSSSSAALFGVRDPRTSALCRSREVFPPARRRDVLHVFGSVVPIGVVPIELTLGVERQVAEDAYV